MRDLNYCFSPALHHKYRNDPLISTHGTYNNPSQGHPFEDPIEEEMKPKSYLFDRANISTHELISPLLVCLWAWDDDPLAGVGRQPQHRKLNDAAYRAIPADIVYAQPPWFTTDRTLISPEPQRFPVSGIGSWYRTAFLHKYNPC